jgi:hypothetical protein
MFPINLKSLMLKSEDIMLSEVSQVQKEKGCVFSLMWKIDLKDKHTPQKQTWSYTNVYVENVCNIGITLWNSRKESKGNDRSSTIL